MEQYVVLIAIVIARQLGLRKILEILILKRIFPEANIKQVEGFIKNTKTSYKEFVSVLSTLLKTKE